jgi:hypothetical protein
MKIAVIGWGSLIWDQRDLEIEGNWHTDGPMLPVEFVRVSSRDRLTLVLVKNVPIQPTLWALSHKNSLSRAIKNLADREGTNESNIGHWPCIGIGDDFEKRVVSVVAEWAQERLLGGAIWTALGPKKPNKENGLATDQQLIEYLRGLVRHNRASAAKEYVEKTPCQIKTPLRSRIRQEFGWS